MKRLFVVLALLVAAGCNDQNIVIVKDGKFDQTRLLSSRGAVVHHLGLDVLGADRLKQYSSAINFIDGTNVIVDIGRSDEAAQTAIDQFNADYDNFVKSLNVTGAYEGRVIICVQRSATYAPPASCGRIIQPGELGPLFDQLFPATAT